MTQAVNNFTVIESVHGLPQDFGSFSLIEQNAQPTERIQIVTLDSIGLQRLDLLKIDVEGMEIEVLKGAQRV